MDPIERSTIPTPSTTPGRFASDQEVARDGLYNRSVPGFNQPITENLAGTDTHYASLLKDLLHLSVDGVKGFRLASQKVSNPLHAELFYRLAADRDAIATELRSDITRRSGETPKEGDAMGIMHRAWIDLKAALTSGDKAIINECERGEDAAVEAFQKALNDHKLPNDLESMLTRHYQSVKHSHDQVSTLKHSMT